MSSVARGRAIALLGALALLAMLHAEPAGAVSSVAPAARGLAGSPIYVDPAVAETLDVPSRRRLAGLLAPRDPPVFVALVAFAPGDAFLGDGPDFLTALAGRLQRRGIYVTYDARGILWTRGYRTSQALGDRADQAARTVDLESSFHSLPGPRVAAFLGALDDPDLPAREARAVAAFEKRTGTPRPPLHVAQPGKGGGGMSTGGWILLVAAALLLPVAAQLIRRRRRGARPVDDRPVLPERVFSLAREASREELAERADAMLIALSALIDAAPRTGRTQRALDGYEAAERVLGPGRRDLPDLVGALVCIDLARHALSGTRELAPPCTYDPRHGPAVGRAVHVKGTELRLCRACRDDVRAGREAKVLRDGSGRPYFEGDTPWAATGYGAWGDPIRAVLERH
ncbi:MAG: hypothetical protein QOE11_1950 [Solirubrobacteraceae bacterium]|jgi:hypothetical protein|nr:hypothetical protein [Solirubrobacteraceae bacterium]